MALNRELLIETVGGDAALADELLTIYIERAAIVSEALRSCEPAAGARLADLAHGIRGSALAIGAAELADLARHSETAFRKEDAAARAAARDALIFAIARSAREAAAALRKSE